MKKLFKCVVEKTRSRKNGGNFGDWIEGDQATVFAENEEEAEIMFIAELATIYDIDDISRTKDGYWIMPGIRTEFKVSVREVLIKEEGK